MNKNTAKATKQAKRYKKVMSSSPSKRAVEYENDVTLMNQIYIKDKRRNIITTTWEQIEQLLREDDKNYRLFCKEIIENKKHHANLQNKKMLWLAEKRLDKQREEEA